MLEIVSFLKLNIALMRPWPLEESNSRNDLVICSVADLQKVEGTVKKLRFRLKKANM